jgi:glucose/arabinose dehydrogenase
MPDVNIVVGNDGSNDLQGGAGKDLIYGFDPNGPQGEVSSITATRVASGLSQALYAVAAPGDSQRLFVVEQTGSIRIVDLASGTVNPTPFLSVPVDSSGERGLLGLAFDPNYATNGFFYIYRTVPGAPAHNEVDRYHVSADPNVADAASLTSIISLNNLSATNHNGGWIGFGPDGDLYIATGENAVPSNAQTLNNLLGKILRIHPDGQIPTDNPFYNDATGDNRAIYDLGLRNPFRDSFDRATGDFYIADVGQNTIEEINAGIKGANYGWPSAEGSSGNPAFTNPIFSYDHTIGQAVIGGYVYRGSSEGLQGQYFFADETTGKVFTMRFNGSAWVGTERTSQITTDHGAINNPTSFGEDAQGNLYIVDYDGDVFRLTPNVVSADQNDTLRGFAGDDMMFGGSGNDLLDGGTGNDTMTGGPGDDRFVFAPGYGADTINDFVAGAGTADKIDLTAFHMTFGSVLARAQQSGGNTVFNFGGGDTLTLLNVSKASLSPDDFVGLNDVNGSHEFNGDGKDDFLWRNDNGSVATWNMDNRGYSGLVIASVSNDWHIADTGDFNGDGKSDILWRNDSGAVGSWDMNDRSYSAAAIASVSNDWHIAGIGDFNGDQKADILWRNDSGAVGTWDMNDRSYNAAAIANVSNDWHIAGTGDFNGDGKTDILWRNDDGTIGIWDMNDRSYSAAAIANVSNDWHIAGTGDFNGDGKTDILWRNDDGTVGTWDMNDRSYSGLVIANVPNDWHIADTGDFNGDNKTDIAWRNDDGSVATWDMDDRGYSGAVIATATNDWHIV